MRSISFLVIFLGLYLLTGWCYHQTRLSKTIDPVYANAGIFAIIALLLVPVFLVFVDKKAVLTPGFITPKFPDTFIGTLLAIAILGSGSLILYANGNLQFEYSEFSALTFFSSLLLMGVIAIAEEVVFRGYILSNLLESFNRWTALLCSALVFAFVHTGNPGAEPLAVINIFIAGVLLGINFTYTKKLWFAISFHFTWNFLQGPVMGYPVSGLRLHSLVKTKLSGNSLLTGGDFGFEASVLQTILFFLAMIVLLQYHRREALNPGQKEKPAPGI